MALRLVAAHDQAAQVFYMTDVKDTVKTLHSTAGPSLGSNSYGTLIELRI
jgi:hypothetical protein